ncbi:flagellar basal-body rod modification protein FlgD [Oceanobacillus limi]|uniref:Flagellar basal-body rod modification protein FlgD n=1 Tax=Oceanobacillus limi TaxID=930131 RepID=A0A1H9Z140_9BACI|nr:flagellar hook assembly protein FlgD [Oceanobacillus limi]SES75189.1 flagellar basal-body rod modification protein FlgD [Oceanobacillus limi]
MTTIDPSLYLKNQQTTKTPSTNLGKDEFLKILMTQLQNQDPTAPMDDKEFISQMTTFSSLEQMMNMTASIDKLVQNQTVSPVIQYSHMIGKEVTYDTYDKETEKKSGQETSVVIAVSQKEGQAVLQLENGEKKYVEEIVQVSQPSDKEDAGDTEEGSE